MPKAERFKLTRLLPPAGRTRRLCAPVISYLWLGQRTPSPGDRRNGGDHNRRTDHTGDGKPQSDSGGAAGASMDDVVKSTVHLSDLSLFQRFNTVYSEYFNDPKPVRTTVGSQLQNILVEIDVVAYTGD